MTPKFLVVFFVGLFFFPASDVFAAPKLTAKKFCANQITKTCKKKRCTSRIRTKLSKSCLKTEDLDGDGVRARYDNCKTMANPDQRDTDTDRVGNACDNAPLVVNPGQEDQDQDFIGDIVDNCPTAVNLTQVDADSDGLGDACDLCPGENDKLDGNGDGVKDCLVRAGLFVQDTGAPVLVAVPTPLVTLIDGSNHEWDLNGRGEVQDGGQSTNVPLPRTNDAFDQFVKIDIDNAQFPIQTSAQLEDSREVVYGPASHAGLQVTRKIYVSPARGFARWLDILENTTNSPIQRTVKMTGNLGSDDLVNTVFASSSGDIQVDAADRWWSNCGAPTSPCAAEFTCGGTMSKTTDNLTVNYGPLTFLPNSRVIFLTVMSQDSPNVAGGETTTAAALRISDSIDRWRPFPRVDSAEMLAGISTAELNDIYLCGGAVDITGRPGLFAAGQTVVVTNTANNSVVNVVVGSDGGWKAQLKGTVGNPVTFSSGEITGQTVVQ